MKVEGVCVAVWAPVDVWLLRAPARRYPLLLHPGGTPGQGLCCVDTPRVPKTPRDRSKGKEKQYLHGFKTIFKLFIYRIPQNWHINFFSLHLTASGTAVALTSFLATQYRIAEFISFPLIFSFSDYPSF